MPSDSGLPEPIEVTYAGAAAARRGTAGTEPAGRSQRRFRADRRWRCSMRTGEVRPLEEIETEVMRFAIAHYRGQMSEVARRLKIGRSTLYRKLDTPGLGYR